MKRHLEAMSGDRVYEYVDNEGVVYYSFHRSANIINPNRKLVRTSWVGEHLLNFLARLRREYKAPEPVVPEPEDPEEVG